MSYKIYSCTRLFDKGYSPISYIKPWLLPGPPRWVGWRDQRSALTGLLVLALSACAALPTPVQTPPPWVTPEVWSQADGAPAAAAPAALADWWRRFDDPLLAQLIDQARLNNTSVQGAQAALRQARALRDVAGAALWPSLGSSISAQRNHSDDRSSNSFQAGLDASWELDVFGAKRSTVAAADATVLASAASLGQVQVSIAAEVALDYIALRSGQERLQIAQANLTSQQETLQLTDWRLQAGLVTTLEAEQARAAAEVTAAQLPALLTQMAQSRHALAMLTGQPPAALSTVLAAPGPVPQAPARLALAFPGPSSFCVEVAKLVRMV